MWVHVVLVYAGCFSLYFYLRVRGHGGLAKCRVRGHGGAEQRICYSTHWDGPYYGRQWGNVESEFINNGHSCTSQAIVCLRLRAPCREKETSTSRSATALFSL
jgi:hypothetical protein